VATFSDLFARLDPDPRVRGKQFDGGGGLHPKVTPRPEYAMDKYIRIT
jgi:hypothetical protein